MMKDAKGATIARLHRLQGQIGGIEKLVDQNQPLPMVLQQLSAASAAVRALMINLLEDRLEQIEDGRVALLPEEIRWVKKLLR